MSELTQIVKSFEKFEFESWQKIINQVN